MTRGLLYEIEEEISLPGWANRRRQELSFEESESLGRVIGGDQGDVFIRGYELDEDEDGPKTVIRGMALDTWHKDLTPEEAHSMASAIVWFAYDSIGLECVEHS